MKKTTRLILILLCLSVPARATAQVLEGKAKAQDGQTLIINGTTIALYGIDAVALDQVCQTKRKKDFPCGRVATNALATLVRHVVVRCQLNTITEPVSKATCKAGPMDIAEQQVLQGWAFADPKTGEKYRRAERAARVLNEGIWKGRFEFPWDWRKLHR